MSWSQIKDRKYQRPIGANEKFIKLTGDSGHSIRREHWAINSVAKFTAVGVTDSNQIAVNIQAAWKTLRFHQPSIAAYPEGDNLSYDVPDVIALEAWVDETFKVVQKKTADELITEIQPSKYATLTFLPASNELLGHTSHWRTDGIGVLLLLDAVLELASSTLPDPVTLAWGEEGKRLAPPIEFAASMPETATENVSKLAQQCLETFYMIPSSVEIDRQGNRSTYPKGTRSVLLTFSPDETTGIVERCKKLDITVTAAVHSSIASANYLHCSKENEEKNYVSTVRFTLRPYLPEPYSSPAYASGLYTTGWMEAVPSTASWMDNAKTYTNIYRRGLSKEYIKSHREYASRLVKLIESIPDGSPSPSTVDISSIGIADNLIGKFKGTEKCGFDITSVSLGVEILGESCVCFVWTFRGRLNLSIVYNESFFDKNQISAVLQSISTVLLKGLSN